MVRSTANRAVDGGSATGSRSSVSSHACSRTGSAAAPWHHVTPWRDVPEQPPTLPGTPPGPARAARPSDGMDGPPGALDTGRSPCSASGLVQQPGQTGQPPMPGAGGAAFGGTAIGRARGVWREHGSAVHSAHRRQVAGGQFQRVGDIGDAVHGDDRWPEAPRSNAGAQQNEPAAVNTGIELRLDTGRGGLVWPAARARGPDRKSVV